MTATRPSDHDPNAGDAPGRDAIALRDAIEARARELGFALVGVTRAAPSAHRDALERWIAAGKHGEMQWIAERAAEACDVRTLLRNARTVISVGDRYHDGRPDRVDAASARGRIARYARGKDYHDVIRDRLRRLGRFIRERVPGCQTRLTGDIHPILEREQAARALLGAIGKHTLLIRPGLGSYYLLGEIITDAEVAPSDRAGGGPGGFEVDRGLPVQDHGLPVQDHGLPVQDRGHTDICGGCTRCIDACPTKAITPWSVDARRCTAYLTIEHRGAIAPEFFGATGDWWFGCDICQEVCPHAQPTRASRRAGTNPQLAPRLDSVDLLEVLGWTEQDRARLVVSSALKRASLAMMKRNALLALASIARRDPSLAMAVGVRARDIAADESEDPIVRAAAEALMAARGGAG
jgi:epoxyqueuosine reductase